MIPDNITFCPLDIPMEAPLVEELKNEIIGLPTFYSSYRTCQMIPLYTPGGETERQKIIESRSPLQWTTLVQDCPSLRKTIEKKFFPFMTPKPRIIVLFSNPHAEVKIHIDCRRKSVHQRQHKLRLVLSGSKNGLWFLTKDGERKHIKTDQSVYVIDGSHPHGMLNNSNDPKITICFGAPWNGSGNQSYLKLLSTSYSKFKGQALSLDPIPNKETLDFFQEDLESAVATSADHRLRADEIPIKP